ncbi:acyl-CoA dehydrogenase family protein [Variovorax terrae]|uniref:Acyl-CoA dehydrogenase family protein n=1 Tax=Variovorax terrae TaxID=2923278 RepID=A0A9X1VUP8_9BURK|nr:acyl-CoA dehydrogenase family protein [Variovorax terrae]MCJ0762359.1 acyl-CoA dehydrogenase family protein [Variovorax terrae]
MTNDQSILKDSIARYLREQYSFAERSRVISGKSTVNHWREFAKMGWLGIPFDSDSGGLDAGPAELAILLTELGRGLVLEPILPNLVLSGALLQAISDSAHRMGYLRPLVEGRVKFSTVYEGMGARTAVELAPLGDSFTLTGTAKVVLGGSEADYFLVAAPLRGAADTAAAGALRLAIVPAGAPGVRVNSYRGIDGYPACSLAFEEVEVKSADLLILDAKVDVTLGRALNYCCVMTCCEAVGVLEVLLAHTLQYAKDRKQFGKSLAGNQVIAHRLVEMRIKVQEARALSELAVQALEEPSGSELDSIISAAKIHVDHTLRSVAESAVQIHGAIAITDEFHISHYFKRSAGLRLLFGDAQWHETRLGDSLKRDWTNERAGKMSLASEADREFAKTVEDFVNAALPKEIAAKVANEQHLSKEEIDSWQSALGRQGWLGASWPKNFGGPGWSPRQQFIFESVCASMNCPAIVPSGVKMIGPLLQKFGTTSQQERFLPRILDSSEWWCQGYSEPNSGSDLSSLRTSAQDVGEHYRINGEKIWTTNAHYADWMFCLVRTSRESRPQQGISFLLIDMRTPGIEVIPITSMDGAHSFNSVVFKNVLVPKENLLGKQGEGWSYAKALLSHERLSGYWLSGVQRSLQQLKQIALGDLVSETGERLPDARLREIVRLEVRTMALKKRFLEFLEQIETHGTLSDEVSELKIQGTELFQDISNAIMMISGELAYPYDPLFTLGENSDPLFAGAHAATAAVKYFGRRANTLAGGATEIQKNILAKTVLGI